MLPSESVAHTKEILLQGGFSQKEVDNYFNENPFQYIGAEFWITLLIIVIVSAAYASYKNIRKLTTPLQRKRFLLFPAGCMFSGVVTLIFPGELRLLFLPPGKWFEVLFSFTSLMLVPFFWLGIFVAIVGLCCSFFRKQTVERLSAWIAPRD